MYWLVRFLAILFFLWTWLCALERYRGNSLHRKHFSRAGRKECNLCALSGWRPCVTRAGHCLLKFTETIWHVDYFCKKHRAAACLYVALHSVVDTGYIKLQKLLMSTQKESLTMSSPPPSTWFCLHCHKIICDKKGCTAATNLEAQLSVCHVKLHTVVLHLPTLGFSMYSAEEVFLLSKKGDYRSLPS